jgi:2-oxoglutarate dehydrogenase E2 component (dihydrolipoamide succinyltransferase)
MSNEILVPTLGESIVEATISKWLKQEGDTVAAGDALLELETDKVNLEVPAEQDGVLLSIARAEGDTVRIGDVIGVIGEGGGAAAEPATPAREQQPPVEQATDGTGGGRGDGREDGNGDGDGGVPGPADTATAESEVYATPVAQRIAAENAIDIRGIAGSGERGRVTKDDVLAHMQQPVAAAPSSAVGAAGAEPGTGDAARSETPPPPRSTQPAAPSATTGPPPSLFMPPSSEYRHEERVRMSRRRQTIAQRLLEAQHNAAMLTTFNEIDMSAVMAVRGRRKERFKERHSVGLGFMSFFVKACIGALKTFPLLNAEVQDDEIVIKHYYDIGIAVGTEQGLVVPVLRDADRKTFAQVEQGITELAMRARESKLSLADLQGGTFSITNGGIYGSLMSTPILNTPQVGILGMHKIEERPVVVEGAVVVRPMMYVALSYDHRIVDGSEAVQFLVRVKELIEDPEMLLLEG